MDIKTIATLIRKISYTSINEFILSDNDVSIRISQIPRKQHLPFNLTPVIEQGKHIVERDENKSTTIQEFQSPMVGIYYCSHLDKINACVINFDQVRPGDRLGVIRAMNINTVIYASKKMIISDILVKNGQPVEYGQTLFLVKYN